MHYGQLMVSSPNEFRTMMMVDRMMAMTIPPLSLSHSVTQTEVESHTFKNMNRTKQKYHRVSAFLLRNEVVLHAHCVKLFICLGLNSQT